MAHRETTATTTTNSTASFSGNKSSSASIKYRVEQKVSSGGLTKKGSYAVERAVEPDDVVIKRRFGEGSKPLFEREDISNNKDNTHDANNPAKAAHRHSRRYSSSHSSSPERFRKHEELPPKVSAANVRRHTAKVLSTQRRTPDKVPYFIDEKREQERLQRIYGEPGDNRKRSRRRRSSTRSRSATPPPPPPPQRYANSKSSYSKSSSYVSSDRDRSFPHSPPYHRTSRNGRRSRSAERSRHHSSRYRRSRSHSRPRSRTRSRERSRCHDNNRHIDHEHHNHAAAVAVAPPATQIITIPVPVDYSYGFPTWPQSHWPAAPGASRFPPPHSTFPTAFPPFPTPVVFPPMRLPPSYGMPPFNARMFRPQRFNSNFVQRSTRGNFRPRNH